MEIADLMVETQTRNIAEDFAQKNPAAGIIN